MPLTRRTITIKEFNPIGDNEAEGYISTREIDFSGDIVIPDGVLLDVYQRHPVVLFGHDTTKIIGKCTSLVVDEYGIKARIDFAPTEFAQDIKKLVKHGSLSGMSIGFIPVNFVKKNERKFAQESDMLMQKYPEYRGNAERIIKSYILIEFSMVANGDNFKAGITQKDINDMEIKSTTLDALNLKCGDCNEAIENFKDLINEEEERRKIKEDVVDTKDSTDNKGKEDSVEVEVVKPIYNITIISTPEEKRRKALEEAHRKEEEKRIVREEMLRQIEHRKNTLKTLCDKYTKKGMLLRY